MDIVRLLVGKLIRMEFAPLNKQVTRGHNIAADGWVGASNPQPHPNPTLTTPVTHSHTHNNNCSIINPHFQLERDGPTDKASYKVTCPQLKIILLFLAMKPMTVLIPNIR